MTYKNIIESVLLKGQWIQYLNTFLRGYKIPENLDSKRRIIILETPSFLQQEIQHPTIRNMTINEVIKYDPFNVEFMIELNYKKKSLYQWLFQFYHDGDPNTGFITVSSIFYNFNNSSIIYSIDRSIDRSNFDNSEESENQYNRVMVIF